MSRPLHPRWPAPLLALAILFANTACVCRGTPAGGPPDVPTATQTAYACCARGAGAESSDRGPGAQDGAPDPSGHPQHDKPCPHCDGGAAPTVAPAARPAGLTPEPPWQAPPFDAAPPADPFGSPAWLTSANVACDRPTPPVPTLLRLHCALNL